MLNTRTVFVLVLLVFACHSAQSKDSAKQPPPLQALIPSLDKSKPSSLSKLKLQGSVQDSYNPSLIAIPKTGSTAAYQAGLQLYKAGDYNRAMTAFRMALSRARRFGINDQRYKAAQRAIQVTQTHLTLRNRLGYDTDNKDKSALTGRVTKLFPPSLAWLGSLKLADKIISAKEEEDTVFLKVERANKIYGLKLKLRNDAKIAKPAKKLASTANRNNYLKGKITHPEILKQGEKRLAKYDCVLMLDCSGSMGDRIVSIGRRNGRLLTRWNWCKNEMLNFYRSGAQYFPEGITLVPFANKFAIIGKARDREIQDMFRQLSPVGGTNMAMPLKFLFDDYFKRKTRSGGRIKPLVIAILSDGEGNAHILRKLIINTTQKMQYPREILITFLAIDATELGRPVIEALDNDLYQAGAKYDIVDSRTFEELQRYGLLKMLVASLLEKEVEK